MPAPSSTRSVGGLVRALLRDQRVAFLLVGGANLAIGLSFFALFHWLLGDRFGGYLVALVLAYACAILCAFVLHRRFVFKVKGKVLRDLAAFTVVQLGAFTVNALVLPFMVEVVHLPVLPAQMVSMMVVVVFSYFGHLMFSFRRKEPVGHP